MVDQKICCRRRAIIVSVEKISKVSMVCIVYGEIGEGSGLKLPLGSSTCVTDGSSKYGFHCMILMGFFDEFYKLMLVSQYFITQRRRKSDLCFQNLIINICFKLLVVINIK